MTTRSARQTSPNRRPTLLNQTSPTRHGKFTITHKPSRTTIHCTNTTPSGRLNTGHSHTSPNCCSPTRSTTQYPREYRRRRYKPPISPILAAGEGGGATVVSASGQGRHCGRHRGKGAAEAGQRGHEGSVAPLCHHALTPPRPPPPSCSLTMHLDRLRRRRRCHHYQTPHHHHHATTTRP